MYALNIDPTNPYAQPNPAELRALGVEFVRFTFKDSTPDKRPDYEVSKFYRHWCEQLARAGIQSLIVLSGESYPNKPNLSAADEAWLDYIAGFARRAAEVAKILAVWQPAFQIWQAPDLLNPEPGYDPALREDVYGYLLDQCYDAIKKVDSRLTVITAGLVSGRPDWLENVIEAIGIDFPADAVALHPYTKRPDSNWPHDNWGTGYVGDLINAYQLVTDLPFWITEIGIDTLSDEEQAEYLSRFYAETGAQYAEDIEQVFWFAYSDGMAPGFGLVNKLGQPKAAYHTYQEIAGQAVQAAALPTVSIDRLHTYAAYLEQNIVFGDRDRNIQRQMELELIGNEQQLSTTQIQQLAQRMLAGSSHSLSAAEVNALHALQNGRDLFRNLRSIVLAVHQRSGGLTGRLGAHSRISAEDEFNSNTNIDAVLKLPLLVQAGNRLIIMDTVKAENDEAKLNAPDIFQADNFGQLRNGLIDNHAWNLQKLVLALRNQGYEDRVILLLRVDGPDEGANVNVFNADSLRNYQLAIAKVTRYLEAVLTMTPFKLVLGNEPDLPHERPWSDPNADPRTFTVGLFAPAIGSFMKELAWQRPDVTFLCPALSIRLQNEIQAYYSAFFGNDRPENLIPALHGYGPDVTILPGNQLSFVGEQAAILRSQGQFKWVSGTELGSDNTLFVDVETLINQDRLDDAVAWLLLSTEHRDSPGQDNQWSFRINPGLDDPLAQTLADAVNRTEEFVIRNIREHSGNNLQLLKNHLGERPPYAVDYLDHNTPGTMPPGQTATVTLTVRNTSRREWRSDGANMVRLGYHWYTPGGAPVDAGLWDDYRTPLPQKILPGDSVTLTAKLGAPRVQGTFEVRWDMVEELITWFAWQGVPTLNVRVTVKPDAPEPPEPGDIAVRASHNNVQSGADNLLQAIDGNPATRWSTRDLQRPGMWFEIDLKETRLVKGLALDNANSSADYPRGYVIRLSTDRVRWQEAARNGHNTRPLDLVFTPQPARFISIEQTGSADKWWSIHQITVRADDFTPALTVSASHNNVQSGADNLLQAIDNNPATRWSTRDLQRPGMWLEIDMNEMRTVSGLALDTAASPNDYPRGYVVRLSTDRVQWQEAARNSQNTQALDVNFSPRTGRYIRVEQTGSSGRWWWSVHGITLKSDDFTPTFTGTASHNNVQSGADNVTQAFDGNPATRWSTRDLQRPGMWFEIDLNEIRTISGLLLDTANSPEDFPRGYVVRLSLDRVQWREVARNDFNAQAVDINFSPRIARYIRIEQTGSADRWWWSIHNVVVK